MTSTYEQVVRAAVRLLTDEAKDTWALADAVQVHVPDATSGKGFAYDPDNGGVRKAVAELAARLKDDGVLTQKGTSYTASTLTHFRDAAMAWPKADRYEEASFSTHQEAANSKDAKLVLTALVDVARGAKPQRPRGFDLEAWNAAVQRVQSRDRGGFKVTVDDLRVARKANVARRPRHRKMTIDRINKLIDAHIEGKVEEEDLYNILPTKIGKQPVAEYVEEYIAEVERQIAEREAREAAIRDQVAAGEEGMTDEERQESDEELTGLQGQAAGLGASSEQAERDVLGGPALQYGRKADQAAGMCLVLGKKHGVPDEDLDELLLVADSLQHKADLIRMMASGAGFSVEDDQFLNDLGVA